jgi:type IV secretory pathway TrbD component
VLVRRIGGVNHLGGIAGLAAVADRGVCLIVETLSAVIGFGVELWRITHCH